MAFRVILWPADQRPFRPVRDINQFSNSPCGTTFAILIAFGIAGYVSHPESLDVPARVGYARLRVAGRAG